MVMNRKGMKQVAPIIEILIGVLVVLVILVQLAPSYFTGLGATSPTGLGNVTANPDVPSWLPTTLVVIVAAGLLFLVWRIFSYKTK